MNWKKWIKYSVIFFTLLTIISFLWMTREGKRMYGGLTERVNHETIKPMEGIFAIDNVNALSPEGDRFIPGQTIVIRQGMIASIDSLAEIPSGTTVIDGTGKYVIPGLIDAHVHLFQSPNDLLLYLANGVTEIRELIGDETHLEWRQQIRDGRPGPKMFVASPRLGSFGLAEGWFMSWSQGYMNVRNAREARELVHRLHDQGYDGIKVYSQLNKESYLAITETAGTLGMLVFGHIPWDLALSDIWENGQNDIVHFEELMNALNREFDYFKGEEEEFLKFVEARSDDLADHLIKNNIHVTSTLWLTESFVRQKFELNQVLSEVELEYENPGISEWVPYIPGGLGWLPEVNRYRLPDNITEEDKIGSKKYWETYAEACQVLARNFSKRGVKIMAGTDANLPPAVPGFSLHDELVSLNRSGMSSAEVLRSATSIPAGWLNSNSGKIATGLEANLVLLDKNPLDDIRNTKAINMVIVEGKVYDRNLLDQLLASVKQANDLRRKINIDRFTN
ncbi:MAG: amidohydrolase family protein [Flammeovirgaceae bacterium]|nr:amidohydrolase family protein [Flammeovirgaceae bacterium]